MGTVNIVLAAAILVGASSQAPGSLPADAVIPQADALTHLSKRVEPEYPPLAEVAQVAGTIQLDVRIAPDGRVAQVNVFKGIPMLNDAAIAAVRRWTFVPFTMNGQPATVRTILDVTVGGSRAPRPHPQSRSFADAALRCQALVDQQKVREAIAECPSSISLVETMGKGALKERAIAGRLNGTALMLADRPAEALPLFEEVVNALRNGYQASPSEELGLAYLDVGRAARRAGNAKRAEESLGRAEKELAGVRDSLAGYSPDPSWRQPFEEAQARRNNAYAETLTQLIEVLKAAGNARDAAKMQSRLDALLKSRR